jgi:hypothetical protein
LALARSLKSFSKSKTDARTQASDGLGMITAGTLLSRIIASRPCINGSDFEVSSNGKVKILSYINNLHPVKHAEMYSVLEEIFEKFILMFEQVLAEMQNV